MSRRAIVDRGPKPTSVTIGNRLVARTAQGRRVEVEPIDGSDGLLSVVRNVELCAVGIEYPLASGPQTFTPDDLVAAVAAQDDPAIQSPRVWLGHPDDQRFHAGRTTPAGSAEPALGKVVGMRIEDEGMTLVGDIWGCPTWLANILASAYPSRSVEGYVDAKSVTGRQHRLVITDLALLGVTWPGVSTLEDLQALYSESGPEGIEVEETMPVAAARGARVEAQAELEKIRRAFVAKLDELKIPGWPWIRAILQDPNELIVDDDEGGLYRLPYDASKDDVVFGELKQVKIQYVNASQKRDPNARTLLTNMLTTTSPGTVLASWDQRTESRPESTQEDHGMNPETIRLLRASLGLSEEQLPDDATEEQVHQVLASRDDAGAAEPNAPTGNPSPPARPDDPQYNPNGPSTTPGQDPQAPPPSPDQVPKPGEGVTASLPNGMIAVPADAWAAVQANAAAGARVAEQSEGQRRDTIVAQALREGRISPAQKQAFRTRFDQDPQGTETLLTASVDKGGLMPGLIPVGIEAGRDPSADIADEAYPSSWLPEVQQETTTTRVTLEG